MKNALVIAIMFTVFGATAQQKLIGTNSVQYDDMGVVLYIDSSEYVYNSWGGSLLSNEPQLIFDGAVFDWKYREPRLSCDQQKDYSGIVQPLSLDWTWNNTIVAGNVTLSESANDRIEYTYDLAGNTTNVKFFYFDGTNFVLNSEETYEYDGSNNLTVKEEIYHGSGSPLVQNIDSMFYAANRLVRSISYSWDGISVHYPYVESLITYSGSQIDNIQLKQGDATIPLTWLYHIDYIYFGSWLEYINGHEVIGGVPEVIPSIIVDFTYGTNGKIATTLVTFDGVPSNQYDFSYDAQGFITQLNFSLENSTQTGLYLNSSARMYYQSTVGVEEMSFTEVVIFPNPSNDFVTIQTADPIENVSVYALNGNIMMTQISGDLNISNLPAGTYIAKVKTASGFAQARFVKG